jgi:hypothetical protein
VVVRLVVLGPVVHQLVGSDDRLAVLEGAKVWGSDRRHLSQSRQEPVVPLVVWDGWASGSDRRRQ